MLVPGIQNGKASPAQHICNKAGTLTAGTYVGVDNDMSFGDQLHVVVHMQTLGGVCICVSQARQGQTCQLWLFTLCKANQHILLSSQKSNWLPDLYDLLLNLQR